MSINWKWCPKCKMETTCLTPKEHWELRRNQATFVGFGMAIIVCSCVAIASFLYAFYISQ